MGYNASMFTNVSITGTGVLITLIESAFKSFGFELPDGSIVAGVNGFITFVGLVMVLIGQLSRKDLHWGLIRK